MRRNHEHKRTAILRSNRRTNINNADDGINNGDIMSTPETIYLLIEGDGHVWCEEPAPGIEQDPNDAIEYIRADVHKEEVVALQKKLKASRDALERSEDL